MQVPLIGTRFTFYCCDGATMLSPSFAPFVAARIDLHRREQRLTLRLEQRRDVATFLDGAVESRRREWPPRLLVGVAKT